MAFFIQYHFA